MITIIVNGMRHDYPHEIVGYSEIADLVAPGSSELTVTYFWKGIGDLKRSGTLALSTAKYAGDGNKRKTINVAEGMIFTAVSTNNA